MKQVKPIFVCAWLVCLVSQGFAETKPTEWQLISIDSVSFEAEATIDLSQDGKIIGSAPCNRYFATLDSTLPDFKLGPVAATRRACPELDAEALYFRTLREMHHATVADKILVLSGPDGKTMRFLPAVPKQ